jgi:hypothetical protein
MTVVLNLTQEEESLLRREAEKQGATTEEYIMQAVKRLLPSEDTARKLARLRSLLEDDEKEQRETGEYLLRAIDEDRLSARKLFS